MTKTKAESLWDWCLGEVLKLPNGNDVWEYITRVKNFAVKEERQRVLSDMLKECDRTENEGGRILVEFFKND